VGSNHSCLQRAPVAIIKSLHPGSALAAPEEGTH